MLISRAEASLGHALSGSGSLTKQRVPGFMTALPIHSHHTRFFGALAVPAWDFPYRQTRAPGWLLVGLAVADVLAWACVFMK